MNDNKPFPANAETMSAIVDGLAALTLILVAHLPEDKRQSVANDLAKLAAMQEKKGNLTLETLLLDLHRAAQSGASWTTR